VVGGRLGGGVGDDGLAWGCGPTSIAVQTPGRRPAQGCGLASVAVARCGVDAQAWRRRWAAAPSLGRPTVHQHRAGGGEGRLCMGQSRRRQQKNSK
jgi:hypothetical protein